MNILAIDCAVSRLCISLKYDDKMITEILDIGMRQSEMLLPTINEILNKAAIKAENLDATALTIGPGSFTGLRLGISAFKAIELAYNIPVYGISSLKAYAWPFYQTELPVLSCIDANKDKFYASITKKDSTILSEDDYELSSIINSINTNKIKKLIISGPDAKKMQELLEKELSDCQLIRLNTQFDTAEALIEITEEMINKKIEPLKDFDGPVYLRASEAEIKLKEQE